MTRDEGLALLREFVKNEALVRHCLAVEAAMRAYAPRYGGDGEEWGLAGLLHDFDWESIPRRSNIRTMGRLFCASAAYRNA